MEQDTVWRILRNEMYTGVMAGQAEEGELQVQGLIDVPPDQWYRVEGTHEAVICRETSDAVQQGLSCAPGRTARARSTCCPALSGAWTAAAHEQVLQRQDRPICAASCMRTAGKKKAVYPPLHPAGPAHRAGLAAHLLLYPGPITHSAELDVGPERNSRRAALEQERKHLAAQVEKRTLALKTSTWIRYPAFSAGTVSGLGRTFWRKKRRLEAACPYRRRTGGAEIPGARQNPDGARPRTLHPEVIPRELVVLLVEKIEIGEKYPDAGRQEIKITWRF